MKSLVVIVAALSWQTLSRVGPGSFAAMVAALVLGAIVLSVISWYSTGYHVVGRELRIHEGVLWRRTRAIPLERLQAVEVVRPLMAQLTGLAELRLEVVGGGRTEAPLAYLTVTDAVALRERLLDLASRIDARRPGPVAPYGVGTADTAPGPVHGPPGPVHGPPGAVHGPPGAVHGPPGAVHGLPGAVHDVPGPAGPLPSWPPAGRPGTPWAVPERPLHAVANQDLLVSQLLTPQAFFLPFGLVFVAVQFLNEGSWSFIAVASTLTAMAGVLLQPVRRVLDDWTFRLSTDGSALRVRHGLLETRTQVVPRNRVQMVQLTWPLLWRPKGWLRMRMAVAGYSGAEADERNRPDRLLPVGDLATARAIMVEVLPGVTVPPALHAPPRRARWFRPLTQPVLGAGLTDEVFAVRHGRITRTLTMVPYARIQSVRLVQGPVQRRLRLATVHVDTAGGTGTYAPHRDLAEANALAAELTLRAHHARQAR